MSETPTAQVKTEEAHEEPHYMEKVTTTFAALSSLTMGNAGYALCETHIHGCPLVGVCQSCTILCAKFILKTDLPTTSRSYPFIAKIAAFVEAVTVALVNKIDPTDFPKGCVIAYLRLAPFNVIQWVTDLLNDRAHATTWFTEHVNDYKEVSMELPINEWDSDMLKDLKGKQVGLTILL